MKKEIPILFSTPMVQAILDGRKTMTRRVIKFPKGWVPLDNAWDWVALQDFYPKWHCPYGKHGDLLWVREAHYRYGRWVKNGATKTGKQKWRFTPDSGFPNIRYQDNPPAKVEKISYRGTGWYKRSSLFMPKDIARIWLEVTGVRVERLQEISEKDAKAEGVEQNRDGSWHDYISPDRLWQDAAKPSFQSLWMNINGEGSWEANPWVWVIEFKVVSKTGKP